MNLKIERNDKKMKRKNGFTLIELLAVIVILAIIALIAVPVVMNIIGRANKSAFKDSAYGILKAGELFYTDKLLETAGLTEDATFNFPDDIDGLEFKGSKPTGGSMTVRKDGKISMAIHNGKHCVTKGFEDEDVQITDDVTNCGLSNGGNTEKILADVVANLESATSTATSGSPLCITKGSVCAKGTLFTINVNASESYNFYVLNDDGNKVDLIMDRNLYSDEDLANGTHNVAWINESDYGCDDIGCSKSDKGPLTALKILKERTRGWTNIPAYTYTLENDVVGGRNTYSPITATSTATSIISGENPIQNVRARLPRREEIYAINNSEDLTNTPWLYENLNTTGDNYTSGYWTSSVTSSRSAYLVEYTGRVRLDPGHGSYYVNVATHVGLRPVITLSK